jgi:NADPH:quinone reductase
MKAIIAKAPGGPLEMTEIPVPEPGPGEVLVKIEAAPVNPSDLGAIKRGQGGEFVPFVPGFEGAGRVIKAGKGMLPRLLLNRRVACSPKKGSGGTWAEYMVTDAAHCFPLGRKVTTEQGSMTLVNPLTALDFIGIAKKGGYRAIVNNAAASGLGRILEILCRKNSINLINIVRSCEKVEELMKTGSTYVINSSAPDFAGQLSALTAKLDARLIFDSVCGDGFPILLEAMPQGSNMYVYGNLSPSDYVLVNPRLILSRDISIKGYYLANRIGKNGLLKNVYHLFIVNRLMSSGFTINVQARFPLFETQKAIDTYLAGMSAGKVIIIP